MSAFRVAVVACACASVMVAGSAAGAGAAVTVGPDVTTPTSGSTSCSAATGAATFSNASLVSGFVSSPLDGVVVRWRAGMQSMGTPPGGPTLRIVRATGLGAFTGAGSSGPAAPFTGVGGPFPARLAIQAGDRIGIDLPCQGIVNSPTVKVLSSGSRDFWNPALLDGEMPGRAPSTGPGNTVLVNADVEADADHDGFGDESQDACPGVFGSVTGCPRADLAVTKTASQSSESDVVTYTLTAQNNGPDPVTDAAISDTLPTGATFVSSAGPRGCATSGRAVNCGVGALATGASSTVTIIARLKAGRQTNTASVSSPALALAAAVTGAGDPNSANNTATASIRVVPPSVSSANASPGTFRLGSLLPKFSRRAPVGTTISFKVSEPATATLTFSQPRTGRTVGRRCVPQTPSNRRNPRCTIPNVRGTLTIKGHAGTNKARFHGRLSHTKTLKPGRYTLTITATDAADNRSSPNTTGFTIVRG